MHIPDGFLDPAWIVATYTVMICYGVVASRKVGGIWSPEKAAVMTVLAAGIFAAQMLNWPLVGGTSLHFVGGALAGILLGPWLGFYAMLIVLSVQCFIFHDGGITALGANVLNMAIIDVLAGYYAFKLITGVMGNTRRARLIGSFLGGWLGITLAGIACGIEIGLSPACPYGISISVPVMGMWHALLGIIEGVITAFVVDYIYTRSPELARGLGGVV